MLDRIFLQVLNMSFTGGIIILFVLLARLVLRRAPKVFSYALWAVVLFRLVCPFSFESVFSLLPVNAKPIPDDILLSQTPQITTGIAFVNRAVNNSLPAPDVAASVNPLQIWVSISSYLWLLGIAVLLIYSIVSLIKLQRRLKGATLERDNIYLSDTIDTPFVMGFVRPKIYLPSTLGEEEKQYIILHEQTHIKRLDHVVKILSFFVLCLHWFNPLIWVAFFLSGKDMEMSCDEAVIKELGTEVKKDYSSSLLTLSTGRRIVGGTPLAFGEGDTKGRIKNVLNYKQPAFWVVVVAVISVVALCVGLAANPAGLTRAQAQAIVMRNYPAPIVVSEESGDQILSGGIDVYTFMLYQPMTQGDSVTAEERLVAIVAVSKKDRALYFYNMGDGLWYDNKDYMGLPLKETATSKNVAALFKNRTSYVGDNSKVGGIINALTFPGNAATDGFELGTGAQPYSVTVNLKIDSATMEQYARDGLQKPYLINAAIMLSLIENADTIHFRFSDGTSEPITLSYNREFAESLVGANLWQQSASLQKFQALYSRIYEHVENAIASADSAKPVPPQFRWFQVTLPANPQTEQRETALRLALPERWTVKPADKVLGMDELGSLYEFYNGEEYVGFIGCKPFALYEGDDVPPGDFYKTVYSELRLGRFSRWDDYTPVLTTETGEIALATVYYLDPDKIDKHPGALASVPEKKAPGILAYDKDLLVYIGIKLAPDAVTPKQQREIAESISFSSIGNVVFLPESDSPKSDSEKKAAMLNQLMSRLEQTIATIDNANSASISWDNQKNEMNVVIDLKPDKKLNNAQVDGIENIIRKSLSDEYKYITIKIVHGDKSDTYTAVPVVQYTFLKFDQSGSTELIPDQKLAEEIIFSHLVVSAAWPPKTDPETLDEYFIIRQIYPEVSETHDYYIYMLEGKPVIQRHKDGMYTIIAQDTYDKIANLFAQ